MIDGAVDAFTDETGVDTTASTNEAFNSTNDLYTPADDGAGITVPMVVFDGTSDYLTATDVTLGQSDGKKFTISSWIDIKGGEGTVTRQLLGTQTDRVRISFLNDDLLRVKLRNSSNTNIAEVTSTNKVTVADGQTHILVAIDLTSSKVQIAINGVLETNINITAPTNDTVDFTDIAFAVGGNTSGNVKFDGEVGQLYLTEEYIDISIAANIAKFYDNGNPVDLGSDGSTPTGNQPLIFLNNPVATWQINLGSGGNFTENGTITAGTDQVVSEGFENLTLISNSQTAQVEPNGANILLLAEVVDADIVLNTDLKASVSQDGGITFSQVTLADAGEFEKGNLLTGTVDLSGTGTDMKWKVETANKKDLNLHGVGLEWR